MMIQQPKQQQLAMISVPWQEYETPMMPAEALLYGTVFPSLARTYTPVNMQQPAQGMQPVFMQKKR